MAGETAVLGENLPRRHFVHHKFHLTNRFSYGAALGPTKYVLPEGGHRIQFLKRWFFKYKQDDG
jgi:hypothetical protein